jgi:hypothetical protein
MINPSEAVITTKYVIYENSKIVYVINTEDGWQFLGQEDVEENDALVVTLNTIIQLDPTITRVLNLNKGQQAFRNELSNDWEISAF